MISPHVSPQFMLQPMLPDSDGTARATVVSTTVYPDAATAREACDLVTAMTHPATQALRMTLQPVTGDAARGWSGICGWRIVGRGAAETARVARQVTALEMAAACLARDALPRSA